jgi:hypothetical protein
MAGATIKKGIWRFRQTPYKLHKNKIANADKSDFNSNLSDNCNNGF